MPPAQPNQSLMHGLACLQAVTAADSPVGSREVARQLQLEHTRVNRLLGTLAMLGLVEQNEERKYLPGTGIHVLSAQSLRGSGLLGAALPVLRGLSDINLTIALGVLWQREVCYLVYAVPGQDPADGLGAHRAYPAHESIVGRVLLGSLKSPELRQLYHNSPPGSFASMKEFLGTIKSEAEAGFAFRELGPSHRSLAVPVGIPPVAALGVTGDFAKKNIPSLKKRLLAAANAITENL